MSEFQIKVVRVGAIGKHPNADTLSITHVYAYPCIIRTGDFEEGNLAAYIPVDSVVSTDRKEFAFLKTENRTEERIKAKRLRGIFSMGLLIPARFEWTEGQDVQAELSVTKYEPPPVSTMGGDNESDPGYMIFYDIEGLRRYPDMLQEGEEVVITEKLHGANARFLWRDERLWVSSHRCYKKEDDNNMWWQAARQYSLADKLKRYPGLGFYAEVYGQVQNLKYGHDQKNPISLAFFDVLDTVTRTWKNYDEARAILTALELPVVPELYRGPWKPELQELAEGDTTIAGADHVREGIVIKPVIERFNDEIGRVILKIHGEGYLTGKKRKK